MTDVRIDSDTRTLLSGCGERLRSGREAAGMSVEEVAAALKMPARIVRALEQEDWGVLGAPVYVRGQVRSYARLLGLHTEPMMAALTNVGPVQPTDVVSRTHIPASRWWAEQIGRRLAYAVLTAALVVPVWITARSHLSGVPQLAESLEAPVAAPAAGSAQVDGAATQPARRTVVASIAPVAPQPQAQPELVVRTRGESWVEIRGNDGDVLEQGLLQAGQERRFPLAQVGAVKLGNASALDVLRAGETVQLEAFSRGDVARFTVSSDGSLAPVP